MAKLTLEIVPGNKYASSIVGTDTIILYWISVTDDQGAPAIGLSNHFTVETLAITWPTHGQRIVLNGGQAVERAPGFYLVGLPLGVETE
jgi:hypothetical protein